MANIVLIDLEQAVAAQMFLVFAPASHRIEYRSRDVGSRDLLDTDIVCCGGQPAFYLSILKSVRRDLPALPFIVVTRIPDTMTWLDALEAGATDYISPPIEPRQLMWLLSRYVGRRELSSYRTRAFK